MNHCCLNLLDFLLVLPHTSSSHVIKSNPPACRTIIYLSVVYALGQVAMAVSAIADITDTNKDGKPDNMTFHV